MNRQEAVNTFNGGLASDIDQLIQPGTTYRDSLNGRIIFNENGTYSWVNSKGNELSFRIGGDYGAGVGNYIPFAAIEGTNNAIILSFDYDGHGEIGLCVLDSGSYVYKTIFNDKYDPNGESLGFSPNNIIKKIKYVFENDTIERIYFAIDNIEPMAFNIKLGVQSLNEDFTQGDYRPLTSGVYPKYYSVNSMRFTPNFTGGTIKFDQHVPGQLETGCYQYAYCLVTKDGYETPYTTPTKHFFVTSDEIDSTDWNKYEMEESGEVSSKGLSFRINNIDTRFYRIKVAYVYYKTPNIADSASIFYDGLITSDEMSNINHVGNIGVPIDTTKIVTQYQTISEIEAIEVKDNTMYIGGVSSTAITTQLDVSDVEIRPYVKSMLSNTKQSAADKSTPMSNGDVYDGATTINKRSDLLLLGGEVKEQYKVKNDYFNYKGTQIEHLYGAYFRGETYRLGVLFRDKKGNPMFVNHLGDFKFPEQYDNTYTRTYIDTNGTVQIETGTFGSVGDYTLTDSGVNNFDLVSNGLPAHDGKIHLSILGLKISNLDLTDVIDLIGSFEIVRVERDPTIIMQGILFQCVKENNNPVVRPTTYPSSKFDTYPSIGWYSDGNRIHDIDNNEYKIRDYTFNFDAPDYMFNTGSLPNLQGNDRLRIVGLCSTEDGNKNYFAKQLSTNSDHVQFLVRPYDTIMTGFTKDWGFGDTTEISSRYTFDGIQEIPTYDPDDTSLTFHTTGIVDNPDGLSSAEWRSVYHNNGILFKVKDIARCGAHTGTSNLCYPIVNYIRENGSPYNGVSKESLAQSIYIPTGHFQEINEDVKAGVLDSGRYIFNNMEVWGGDCFLNFFGYARYYEKESGGSKHTSGGWSVPIESVYNHSMKKGRTWDRYGLRDIGELTDYTSGVDETNVEDFNLNETLTESETLAFYTGLPIDYRFLSNFPVRWMSSQKKYYGEKVDNFRHYLANDFYDVDGVYGKIVSSAMLFNSIYSIQESAFGKLRAFDRQFTQSVSGETLLTGTGGSLDGVDYISIKHGTQHPTSVSTSDKGIYFVDANNGALIRFAQDGITNLTDNYMYHSEIKDLCSYYTTNIRNNVFLLGGILTTFDFENKDVLFTFKPYLGESTPTTISFNEINNTFISRYSFFPDLYFNIGNKMFTSDRIKNTGGVYIHNIGNRGKLYDETFESYIRFFVNQHSDYNKTFGNSSLNINTDGFECIDSIELSTEKAITHTIDVQNDKRCRYRLFNMTMPLRGISNSDTLKGKTLDFKIHIDNTQNLEFKLKSVKTFFRMTGVL